MKTNRLLIKVFSLVLYSIALLIFVPSVMAQVEWPVSDSLNEIISFLDFDEDRIDEGRILYNRSCASCHGNPGQANYAILVPSPGDPADARFQDQSDGALFHKINVGRELMPAFNSIFAEEEIWSLVAYFRSFNSSYEQPKPDLTGIYIPELTLQTEFDENIDKLVVKVFDRKQAAKDVEVRAYIKGSFGNYSLGQEFTNEYGLTYFHVDDQMPGDAEGKAHVIIRAKKGYGSVKSDESYQMLSPAASKNPIEGRHIWSSGRKAPYWLYIVYFATVLGIWGAMIYVVIGLTKLKKAK